MVIFIFCAFILIILYGWYSEKNNPIYSQLTNQYGCKLKLSTKNTDRQMLYFWLNESPKKKDYINGMFVYTDDSGVYIKPTIIYFSLKSLFIPWDKLEKTGELTRWFENKVSYSIKELGITIAFTSVAKITT
jgi:hypothetical protein